MDFSMFENMRFGNDSHMNNNEIATTEQNGCNISRFPEQTPVGMTYTPVQQWGDVYDAAEALNTGTAFPELNLPLEAEGGVYGKR